MKQMVIYFGEISQVSVYDLQVSEVVHERHRVWHITVEVILGSFSALKKDSHTVF